MQVADKTVVSFEYTLTDGGGRVLDTSTGRAPLTYIHGARNIIPGLEVALAGRSVGDAFAVSIPAAEAYGERDSSLMHVATRSQFPSDAELETGMQFQAGTPDGVRVVTIVAIDGDQVTLDGNHPLAGLTLNFDVTIVDVRVATAEELEHGHAHGPGGHDHD